MESGETARTTGSNSPIGEGRVPRALREDEWQAAQPFITPELKARFTLSDGSVDYKAMSKLIPLQADTGPLDVVYEDEDLIAVYVIVQQVQENTTSLTHAGFQAEWYAHESASQVRPHLRGIAN